jgi:aminomethyltransferase
VSAQQTALFDCHQRLGAHMVEFAHTWLPLRYGSEKEEHLAVRHAIGIFDVSHMGEILISGPQAPAFLNYILTNNINKLATNKAQYNLLLNQQAGIVDDLMLYFFGDNRYMLCVNAANIMTDWQWIFGLAHDKTQLTLDNASRLFSQLALQGPKSAELLQKITDEPLPERFAIKEMLIDNIACLVARTGYTGEDGFEIFLSNAAVEPLYTFLLTEGQDLGIKPCGLAARDSLRLEAGMRLHGTDMNDGITPLEAGLMFAVDLNKPDFLGKEALLQQQKSGPKKILTGFKLQERGIARHGYEVLDKECKKIGEVSSGSWPPTQATSIGFAYLDPAYNQCGREVFIKIRDRHVAALITKTKFI